MINQHLHPTGGQPTALEPVIKIIPSIVIALDDHGAQIVRTLQRHLRAEAPLVLQRTALLIPAPQGPGADGEAEAELLAYDPAASLHDAAWEALGRIGSFTQGFQALANERYAVLSAARSIYLVGQANAPLLLDHDPGAGRGLVCDLWRTLQEYGITQSIRVAFLDAAPPAGKRDREGYYNDLRGTPWQELLVPMPIPDTIDEWPDEPYLSYCYLFTDRDNSGASHTAESTRRCIEQTLLALLTSSLCDEGEIERLFDLHTLATSDWLSVPRIGSAGTVRFVYPRPPILDYAAIRMAGEVLIPQALLPGSPTAAPAMGGRHDALLEAALEQQSSVARAIATDSAASLADSLRESTRITPPAAPRWRRRRFARRRYQNVCHSPLADPGYESIIRPIRESNFAVSLEADRWVGRLKTEYAAAAQDLRALWEPQNEERWQSRSDEATETIHQRLRDFAQHGGGGFAEAHAYLDALETPLKQLSSVANDAQQLETERWQAYLADYRRRMEAEAPSAAGQDDADLMVRMIMDWLAARRARAELHQPTSNATLAAALLVVPTLAYALAGATAGLGLPLGVIVALHVLIAVAALALALGFRRWRVAVVRAWAHEMIHFRRAVLVRQIEEHEFGQRLRALHNIAMNGVGRGQVMVADLLGRLTSVSAECQALRQDREHSEPPTREIWAVQPGEFRAIYAQLRALHARENPIEQVGKAFLADLRHPRSPVYLLDLSEDELLRRTREFCQIQLASHLRDSLDTVPIAEPEVLFQHMQAMSQPLAQAVPLSTLDGGRPGYALLGASAEHALAQVPQADLFRFVAVRVPNQITMLQFQTGIWPQPFLEAGVSRSDPFARPGRGPAAEEAPATPPAPAVELTAGWATDVGRIRDHNEDYFFARTWPWGGIFIVADGMGGHEGGEVASRLAVDVIVATILEHFEQPSVVFAGPPGRELVEQAILAANRAVCQAGRARSNTMGTTVTMALVVGEHAIIGNVGDSRTYHWDGHQLSRLTEDHSLVMRLVALGQITEDDIYEHPQRNAIIRCLGGDSAESDEAGDTYEMRLSPGQALVLCSDGLWEMVRRQPLAGLVAAHADQPDELCQRLIRAANDGGGEDNITCVVVLRPAPPAETGGQP